jgi:hypothetical protein
MVRVRFNALSLSPRRWSHYVDSERVALSPSLLSINSGAYSTTVAVFSFLPRRLDATKSEESAQDASVEQLVPLVLNNPCGKVLWHYRRLTARICKKIYSIFHVDVHCFL